MQASFQKTSSQSDTNVFAANNLTKVCCTMQVLSYGIGTAAVLRLVMILLGSELIESWKPVLLLFAGILLFSSFKLLTGGKDEGEEEDLTDNGIVKLCR